MRRGWRRGVGTGGGRLRTLDGKTELSPSVKSLKIEHLRYTSPENTRRILIQKKRE